MTQAAAAMNERHALTARILALCPQDIMRSALEGASVEQLRALADMVEAERDRYAALGFVDAAEA